MESNNDSDIDYNVVADCEDVLSQQFVVDEVQHREMDTTNSSLGKRPREYVESSEQNLKLQKQRKLDVESDSNDDFTESKMVVFAEEIKYQTPTHFQLNVNDLQNVAQALKGAYFPSDKWSSLGLNLGLQQPTLTTIEANHKGDVERCLRECLTEWLNQADNVNENGGPTLDSLAGALMKIRLNAAAGKIKEIEKMGILACQILNKQHDNLSQQSISVKLTQTLFSEGVLSKEILEEVNASEGVLSEGPFKALQQVIYRNPKHLSKFGCALLKSKQTAAAGTSVLKEYDQMFPPQVTLPPGYQSYFNQIQVSLGNLFEIVVPLIAKKIPSLEELSRYLRRCFRELRPQLHNAKSFDAVMEIVENKCTVINVCCLEAIVDHYSITDAKSHIKDFKSKVNEFCDKVRGDICSNGRFLIASSPHQLTCETIEFVVEWEADKCTLNDIRGLLSIAFKGMVKTVRVTSIMEGKSIVVTCYAPQHMLDCLVIIAEENLDHMKDVGLIKLSIGYHTLFDRNKENEEIRALVEEKQRYEEEVEHELKSQENSIREKTTENNFLTSRLRTIEEEVMSLNSKIKEMSSIAENRESDLTASIKKNNAMILQIEQLQKALKKKEGAETEVSEEANKEIEDLQEVVTVLRQQLRERDKQIDHLKQIIARGQTLSEGLEETKIQELEPIQSTIEKAESPESEPDDQSDDDKLLKEAEKDVGTVKWSNEISRVSVVSPTTEQCEDVIKKLIQRKEEKWSIVLSRFSPESALKIIENVNECFVRELDIRDAPLDSTCVSSLSEMLKENTTIKSLHFQSSPFTGGIKPISDALSINTTLEEITMWNIIVTDEDNANVSDMLSKNETLKVLSLFNCSITDNGIQYIIKGLNENQSLIELNLSRNPLITSVSTSTIVEFIHTTTSLAILHLNHTSLEDDDIKSICDVLNENNSIQELWLSKQQKESCEKFDNYETIKDKVHFW